MMKQNEEVNEFMGYSLFNDVLNNTVQAFNRAVVIRNIRRDLGLSTALNYIENFPMRDRIKISTILALVAKKGWGSVRKDVQRAVA